MDSSGAYGKGQGHTQKGGEGGNHPPPLTFCDRNGRCSITCLVFSMLLCKATSKGDADMMFPMLDLLPGTFLFGKGIEVLKKANY